MFKGYYKFQMISSLLKTLYNVNAREKSIPLVNTIKNGLIDLKNEIKKMSEDEIKTEKPYKIVDIVEKILKFNKQTQEGRLKNFNHKSNA